MSRQGSAERRRRRLVAVLRWVAACSWLVFAVALFRVPLTVSLAPLVKAVGLEEVLGSSAPGFVLRVVSEPPGGRLLVDGVDRGEVPLFANVICREGQPIRIRVVREGFRSWEREVGCREGRTLLVRARLRSME